VCNVSIESLPSANIEDNSTPCDVCTKKEMKNTSAVIYCTYCHKLLCQEHNEVMIYLKLSTVLAKYLVLHISTQFLIIVLLIQ